MSTYDISHQEIELLVDFIRNRLNPPTTTRSITQELQSTRSNLNRFRRRVPNNYGSFYANSNTEVMINSDVSSASTAASHASTAASLASPASHASPASSHASPAASHATNPRRSTNEIYNTLNSTMDDGILMPLAMQGLMSMLNTPDRYANEILDQVLLDSLYETSTYKQVLSSKGESLLKTIKYNKSCANSKCPIYHVEFEEDQEITQLPCGHCFITEGIKHWLKEEKAECPVCRDELPSFSIKNEETDTEEPSENDLGDLYDSDNLEDLDDLYDQYSHFPFPN